MIVSRQKTQHQITQVRDELVNHPRRHFVARVRQVHVHVAAALVADRQRHADFHLVYPSQQAVPHHPLTPEDRLVEAVI